TMLYIYSEDYYDIPDVELTIDIEDFVTSLSGNNDIQRVTVSVKWYTSVSETIKVDIYNFDTTSYENKISAIHDTNTKKTFEITSNIQDYISISDEFRLKIYADNYASQYDTYIDYIAVQIYYKPDNCSIIKSAYYDSSYDLNVTVDLQVTDEDCYIVDSLSYSYKTNVSATIDFDIWNWTSSSWVEIESVNNYYSFDDDLFYLGVGSDFVSSSKCVRVRFQCIDNPTDFEIQINQLRLNYFRYS
ncbi:MAG: hypothetical protein ACFE9Z_17760, partial [Promethearchaeota archaeon]